MLMDATNSNTSTIEALHSAHREPCCAAVARRSTAAAGQKYGPAPLSMRVPRATVPIKTRTAGMNNTGRTPHPSFSTIPV